MMMAAAAASAQFQPAWAGAGASATSGDVFTPAPPNQVKLRGLLSKHVDSLRNRLQQGQSATYLEPFTSPVDTKGWRAENIGKWLEAACSYQLYTGDPALKAEIQQVVETLLKQQQPDGWLGSYAPEIRFHHYDWIKNVDKKYEPFWMGPFYDVWCHNLTMGGLLRYYEFSGDARALDASKKMADLLAATFGPGKQDMMLINHDHGFGPAVAIWPVAKLYLLTGDTRYLEFCRYILGEFGRKGKVPIKMNSKVERGYPFTEAAHIKHCEFELCLMGMSDLYRGTHAADVMATMRNIYDGYFAPLNTVSPLRGFKTPVDGMQVPDTYYGFLETCDVVPMARWYVEMSRLSGDSRYLDAMEWQVYNSLLSRDLPDGKVWPGVGAPTADLFHCCSSMLNVGLASLPGWTYFQSKDGILINFYESSELAVEVAGARVKLAQSTEYPLDGRVEISVDPDRPTRFDLLLRIPQWCRSAKILVNGKSEAGTKVEAGRIAKLTRLWKSGDKVTLSLDTSAQVVRHRFTANPPQETLTIERGPLLLAAIAERNQGIDLKSLRPPVGAGEAVSLQPTAELKAVNSNAVGFQGALRSVQDGKASDRSVVLVPYAYAKVSEKPNPPANDLLISVYAEDGVGPNVRVEFPASGGGSSAA